MENEVAPPLCNGRYKLIGILGAGGMAKVYKAYDKRLEVYRAIKILSPAYASHPEIRKRFLTEARTTARLNHPNIVTAHDIGADGERLFIVMEFVEGGSLWDRMRETGPLSPRHTLEVMAALLPALQNAHDHGVIHRDIKPGNILIAKDGTYKLADFGIARVAEAEGTMTRTGSLLGTPAYMAPEQWNGSKEIDPRADIFAMGATLYSLLTQRTPQDIHIPEAQVEQLRGLPERLAAIIMRATRYRPVDRYGTALEMLDAIRMTQDPPSGNTGDFSQASAPTSLPTGSIRNIDEPDDVPEPVYLRLGGGPRAPRPSHVGASAEVPLAPTSGTQQLREVFVGDLAEGIPPESDEFSRPISGSVVSVPPTPANQITLPRAPPLARSTPPPRPPRSLPRLPRNALAISKAALIAVGVLGLGWLVSGWVGRRPAPVTPPVAQAPTVPAHVQPPARTLTPPEGQDRGTLVAECRPDCLVAIDEQPVGKGKITQALRPGTHGVSMGETGGRLRTTVDIPKDGEVRFCYDTEAHKRCAD